MPDWLSFDGQAFTGTPEDGDTGILALTVVATDGSGATLTFSGDLQTTGIVLDDPLPGNDDNPPGGGAPFSDDTALVRLTCTLESDVTPGERILNTSSMTWK